jgi:hypothetical protein
LKGSAGKVQILRVGVFATRRTGEDDSNPAAARETDEK